ncbi:MAG: T9SS type A sorting domain-containing protein [Saprospiraceae bacterium]|nr:T9SS type A sorting domain-containing protein [Saprospiraceae bacterium]
MKQFGITNYFQKNANIYIRDFDTSYKENREDLIILDKDGKLVEEIIFTGPWSDPFGKFSGAIKLKDEPGMLVLIESNNNPAPNRDRIYFYKTDGEGNMSLLKEIKVNTDYVPLLNYLLELENGDILWNALFRVRGGPSFIDDRTITSRWSRESLGLSSSADHEKDNGMKVYPNPVKSTLLMSNPDFEINRIQVFDLEGKKHMDVNFSPSNQQTVEISGLSPGMYLVQAIGKQGQLIYTGKIIKE